MSKSPWVYKDDKPEIAYLGGIVDVLADNLSQYIDPQTAFTADVFEIPGGDLSLLRTALRTRLNAYSESLENPLDRTRIEAFDFQLRTVNQPPTLVIKERFREYTKYCREDISVADVEKQVDNFFQECTYYIYAPKAIYEIDHSFGDPRLIGELYLGIGFEYYVVQCEDIALLLVFGTTD